MEIASARYKYSLMQRIFAMFFGIRLLFWEKVDPFIFGTECRPLGNSSKMNLVLILLHLTDDIDFLPFPVITNPKRCHTHFAPAGFDAPGHMLEIIVIGKDMTKRLC